MVTDKGYRSNPVLTDLAELELRSYVSEPQRGGAMGRPDAPTRCGVRQSAADQRQTWQAADEVASRAGGTQFRALLRDGRDAAGSLEKAEKMF